MNWRTHLPRTWLLGVSTLVLALAGGGSGAEPSRPPTPAPGPATVNGAAE